MHWPEMGSATGCSSDNAQQVSRPGKKHGSACVPASQCCFCSGSPSCKHSSVHLQNAMPDVTTPLHTKHAGKSEGQQAFLLASLMQTAWTAGI